MSRAIEIGAIVIFAEEPPAGFKPPDGKRWFVLLDPADFAAATYVKSLAEQRGVSQDELTLMVDQFVEQAAQVDPNADAPPHSAVEKRLREFVGNKADFASFPMSGPMLAAVNGFMDWVAPAAGAETTQPTVAEHGQLTASESDSAKLKAAVADPRYYTDAGYRANVDAQFRATYGGAGSGDAAAPAAPATEGE